jgi:hypothetical protein
MRKANFLTSNMLFYIEHNGDPGVGMVDTADPQSIMIRTGGRGFLIDDTFEYSETEDSVTYNKTEWQSSFTIRFLKLSDAEVLFPNAIKTFNDIDSLTLSAQEALMASGFEQADEAAETFSFTVDNNNNVLELIKTTEAGDILYRTNGGWTMLGQDEEAPTIFDQKLIDIDKIEVDNATAVWDDAEDTGKDISYEEIRPFASIKQ